MWMPMDSNVLFCVGVSVFVSFFSNKAIPYAAPLFISAGLHGKDMAKKNSPMIAESLGSLCGLFYLLALFLLLPIIFFGFDSKQDNNNLNEFATFLSAIISIQSMLFLGFADDVLNIKWRYKIFLPALASIPILCVYYIQKGLTSIVIPKPITIFLGLSDNLLDLGFGYYIYMAMMAIFCTNSINILAGINGLEVGQSLVISITTAVNSVGHILFNENPISKRVHILTIYLILPFIGVSMSLLKWNYYPAKVFVGDSYTYFAGMVLAVCAILGHFSKTMLLFLIPQIFNFIFSIPQLFHILPCPRHRLPLYDSESDLLKCSFATVFEKDLTFLGRKILFIASFLKLSKVNYSNNNNIIIFSNFTLINAILFWYQRNEGEIKKNKKGVHERRLTYNLIIIQIICSFIGLTIRYGLAQFIYY